MGRTYHERWLRMWDQHFRVLGYEGENSGVVTDGGRMLLFQTREALRRYAMQNNIALKDSLVVLDFDAAMNFPNEPTRAECVAMLRVIDLVDDMSDSTDRVPISREGTVEGVYEKLEKASLMPAVSSGPPVPVIFSDKEREVLKRHVREGYALFVRGTMVD